ncbi:hypothetical protein [Rhizobium straminoryzae]|uniref:Uncharacterized protein n=1 Tax=Rhizobium straminoryzae TaxID=1387186 RepID=A0A549TFS0_9HYPH|nr:hypothetical protein [Rhizobium straminoryzae]TRL41340.1 hypothetical protein FNA46_05235 [Rhizobium straminoryzae]
MTPSELDEIRKEAHEQLEKLRHAPWLAVASECDTARKQFYFWFRVSGSEGVKDVAEQARSVLSDIAVSVPACEFNVAIVELSETEEIIWDDLEDAEIRYGIHRVLGQDPEHKRRKEFSVFDRRI